MSKGEELYVRKSRSSDRNMSDTDDQMWDDSSMTAAYDKAVNKANAEIAKQIAMQTNSKFKGNAKTNEKKGKAPMKPVKPKQWKEGMHCRAKYFEDGIEYEAIVSAILDENECVVRFLGFENSEIVCIGTLKESRGEEQRIRQIELATGDKDDDGFESQSNGEISVDHSELLGANSSQRKGKKPTKKKAQKPTGPDFPIPNMTDLLKMNNAFTGPMPDFRLPNIPLPPPPPTAFQLSDPEEHALSAMLVSWYMSGYHTGLYQGLKRSKEQRRHHQ